MSKGPSLNFYYMVFLRKLDAYFGDSEQSHLNSSDISASISSDSTRNPGSTIHPFLIFWESLGIHKGVSQDIALSARFPFPSTNHFSYIMAF